MGRLHNLPLCRVDRLNQLLLILQLLSVLVGEVKLLLLVKPYNLHILHKLGIAGHESVQNPENIGVGLHLGVGLDVPRLELEPVQDLLDRVDWPLIGALESGDVLLADVDKGAEKIRNLKPFFLRLQRQLIPQFPMPKSYQCNP